MKDLKPLPKLPRAKATDRPSGLKPMPRLRPEKEVPEVIDECKPLPGEPTEVGRWWRTSEKGTQYGGTCVACYKKCRATSLRWYARYMFGELMWEGWACNECRRFAKGWEATRNGAKVKRPTESKPAKVLKQSDKEREHWFRLALRPQVDAWENEGGKTGKWEDRND